jgi:hypothetical protein
MLYNNLNSSEWKPCIINVFIMMRFQFRIYATGGCNENCQEVSCAEYSEDGSTFVLLPQMPEAKYYHGMTVLESGDIFVAGGDYSKSVFIYECEKKQWKRCPDMLTERNCASCEVIKRGDGKEEVVVAGGWNGTELDTVEIYNLEDSMWRSGIARKSYSQLLTIKQTFITKI